MAIYAGGRPCNDSSTITRALGGGRIGEHGRRAHTDHNLSERRTMLTPRSNARRGLFQCLTPGRRQLPLRAALLDTRLAAGPPGHTGSGSCADKRNQPGRNALNRHVQPTPSKFEVGSTRGAGGFWSHATSEPHGRWHRYAKPSPLPRHFSVSASVVRRDFYAFPTSCLCRVYTSTVDGAWQATPNPRNFGGLPS